MRKSKGVALIVLIVAIVAVLLLIPYYYLFGTLKWTSRDIDKWHELEESFPFLPSVEEMGDYDDLKFKHFHQRIFLLFESDAYTLRASYSAEEYEKQKEQLNTYVFQENFIDDSGSEPMEVETFFELDGFAFRMLSLDDYDDECDPLKIALEYPKHMVFVGACDEKREIAFVYYYDFDLDYIDDPFPKFLSEECGWE